MDKLERGTRNLNQLQGIASRYSGRVTFWNPTPDQKATLTIHHDEARLISLVYDALNPEIQEGFRSTLATVSGFNRIAAKCWQSATYKS
mgnify:CR=1 FL=1